MKTTTQPQPQPQPPQKEEPLRELALFAGHGGGILGGILCGFHPVCAVEIDDYSRRVLMARQEDGCLPAFPIWDDVRTFDGRPWRGVVDIVTGGFPCQDVSIAGPGGGLNGERSGLWKEQLRIVGEVEPRFVFVENSPALTYRGLDEVLLDLAALGYHAVWGVLGAVHAGAPHKRERIWILAYSAALGSPAGITNSPSREKGIANQFIDSGENVSHADSPRRKEQWSAISTGKEYASIECGSWWESEPAVGRVADGVPWRVDRLSGLGNAQVPAVVKIAWDILRARA